MNPFGTGGRPRPKDKRDFDLGSYLPPTAIPEKHTTALDSSVLYQGTYGTCGGHAGATQFSHLWSEDLSPKYLWKCIKKVDGIPLDNGTSMRAIYKALKEYGDCALKFMPNDLEENVFQYSDTTYDQGVIDDAGTRANNLAYAFIDYPTFDQIKQTIHKYGTCMALVDIGDGWWKPSWRPEDILPLKLGNKVGGHFIVLYGYDKNNIYFRNSWGTEWGNGGNGHFTSDYVKHVRELGTLVKTNGQHIFTNDLYIGMTSADVKKLQSRLGVTPQTGYFGAKTLAAVRAFQKANGIWSTGYVGKLTRQALNRHNVH